MFKPSARNSETLRQGELLGDGGIEIPSAWSAEHISRSHVDGNGPKSEMPRTEVSGLHLALLRPD